MYTSLLFSCADDRFDSISQQDVALTSIKVIFVPQNNNGIPWDEDSKPDIGYILLNDQSKILLESIEPIEGDVFDLPLDLHLQYQTLPSVDHNYTLLIVDFDKDGDYQVMGSQTFNLNKAKDDLLEQVTLTSGDLKAVLFLHWGVKR